ncbi:MAG: DUF885 family protein [Rhodospirillales bacterium]
MPFAPSAHRCWQRSCFRPLAAHAADNDTAAQFHALLADHWQWQLREFPERATSIGDNRYNDRLTDLSASAVAGRKKAQREFMARLNQIDASKLTGQDSVSYAAFATQRRQEAKFDAMFGDLPFSATGDSFAPVTQMFGPQIALPALARQRRFGTCATTRTT